MGSIAASESRAGERLQRRNEIFLLGLSLPGEQKEMLFPELDGHAKPLIQHYGYRRKTMFIVMMFIIHTLWSVVT